MKKIVECRNIYKNYYQGKIEIPVLKDINFVMNEGDYTAVIGPSGSGKSTLMNLIGCLDKATSGSLLIDGREVGSLSRNELADLRLEKIGFVFQNFQLLGGQTALENVELPLTYANIPRKLRKERAERTEAEGRHRKGAGQQPQDRPRGRADGSTGFPVRRSGHGPL